MPNVQFNFSQSSGCMSYILKVITMTIVIILAAHFMQPNIQISSPAAGLLAAALIAVLNIFLRPILLLLTLPFSVVTLGLFVFVINAGIIWLTSRIVDGFYVSSFGWAFLLALIISAVSYLLQLPERWMNQNRNKNDDGYDENNHSGNSGGEFTDYEEVDDEGNPIQK